jgi:hypothetical protein
MESKTIAVSKKASLASRISETGKRVRNWLNVLEVPFDHAIDKLQLKKCELVHDHCVYHYGIVRGAPSLLSDNEAAVFGRRRVRANDAGREEIYRKSWEEKSAKAGWF